MVETLEKVFSLQILIEKVILTHVAAIKEHLRWKRKLVIEIAPLAHIQSNILFSSALLVHKHIVQYEQECNQAFIEWRWKKLGMILYDEACDGYDNVSAYIRVWWWWQAVANQEKVTSSTENSTLFWALSVQNQLQIWTQVPQQAHWRWKKVFSNEPGWRKPTEKGEAVFVPSQLQERDERVSLCSWGGRCLVP